MPTDNIVELQIGQTGDLVQGVIDVDYTNATISGPGLGVKVGGQLVGLTGLTLQNNGNGTYTVAGATASVGGLPPVATVDLSLNSQTPTTVTTTATVAGVPVSVMENVLSAAVCYVTGTLIRTTKGDVAVEALAVADLVVTASGAKRPIKWIGHREVVCGDHARPSNIWPIRIRAGAFGGDLPERDLWLSPGHPVLIEHGGVEHLVPIMCLINGTTIERVPVAAATYWHIELDDHDILLAEGLPAESFLDFGNRRWFAADNQRCAADHALMNPEFIPPGLDARCRPVAVDGPVVEAERRRLTAVFEMNLAAASHWPKHDGFNLSF